MLDPPLAWQLFCSLPLLLLAAVHFSCTKSGNGRRARFKKRAKPAPSSAPNLDVYDKKVRSYDRPKASEDDGCSALGLLSLIDFRAEEAPGSAQRPFPTLPSELHAKILTYLNVADRMRARAVNRYWFMVEAKETFKHEELIVTDDEEFAVHSKIRNVTTMFLTHGAGKFNYTFARGLEKLNLNYLFKQIIFKIKDPHWAGLLRWVKKIDAPSIAIDIEDDKARHSFLQRDFMQNIMVNRGRDREHVAFGGHIRALSEELVIQFIERVANGEHMLRSVHFGMVRSAYLKRVFDTVDADYRSPEAEAVVRVCGRRINHKLFATERVIVVVGHWSNDYGKCMLAIHRLNEDGTWPTDIPLDVAGRHRVRPDKWSEADEE